MTDQLPDDPEEGPRREELSQLRLVILIVVVLTALAGYIYLIGWA